MAASFNEVTLIGRLGRDPETRNTQAGAKVVNLRVATSETWTDKNSGERQERTEWHTVVVMNDRLADVAEKYLRKGSLALFRGKLQTRKWTDKDGADRYSTEVMLGRIGAELVLLDKRGDDAAPAAEPAPRQQPARGGSTGGMASRGDDLSDEIPFSCEWR